MKGYDRQLLGGATEWYMILQYTLANTSINR